MPENSQETPLSMQESVKARHSATKVRGKNPGHVPVIATSTRECTENPAERSKLKLLVPQDRTGKKFISDVRKRVPLAEDTDEVFVGGKKVREDSILSQLDEAYAAEDGFLYAEVRPISGKTVHFSEDIVVRVAANSSTSPAEECKEQVSSLAGELKKSQVFPCRTMEQDELRSKTRDADILQSALELEQEKNRVREQRLVEVVTEVKSAEAASRAARAEANEVTKALQAKEAQGKENEQAIEALKQELAEAQAEILTQRAMSSGYKDLVKLAEEEAAKAAIVGMKLSCAEAAACQAAARAEKAEGALEEAQKMVAELRERAAAAEREVADARDEMELQQAGFSIVSEHGEHGGEDDFVIVDTY